MEDNVIHKFRFRETEVSHITIARGEQLILEPDADFANGVKLKEFCIVPSQPEEVRIRGNVITGLKAGSSTLTISYIVQRGDVNEVKEDIKIRIHVVEPAYYVGEFARLMMPIHILDPHREWLCEALNITTCHQLLAYADKHGFDPLAEAGSNSDLDPKIDAFALRIWLRQCALFQVEGMTRDIAFLAAVAGVRNAEDLARVSQVKLISAFRSLLPSAAAFLNQELKLPDTGLIGAVLEAAQTMIIASHAYNFIVFGNDPEPTYLMDTDDSGRTDSDILNEGLQFLQNITVALPLPRTISGRLLMRKTSVSTALEPAAGCKVQISGIANPAADRVEDEEDLFCYTDNDGFFTILMPERYNMQECITLTVSENMLEKHKGFFSLSEAADAVHTMTFVRRASEIMDAEYIWVRGSEEQSIPEADKPRYRKAGKSSRDVWKPAMDVLRDFDRLQHLNSRNMLLESRMKAKTDLKRRETLQLLNMKNSLLAYQERIDALIAELEKHRTQKLNELQAHEQQRMENEVELLKELRQHRLEDVTAVKREIVQIKAAILSAIDDPKDLEKIRELFRDGEPVLDPNHQHNAIPDREKPIDAILQKMKGTLLKRYFEAEDKLAALTADSSYGSGSLDRYLSLTHSAGFSPSLTLTGEQRDQLDLITRQHAERLTTCERCQHLLNEQDSARDAIKRSREEAEELDRVIGLAKKERNAIRLPEIDKEALVDALGSDTAYVIDPPRLADYGVEFRDYIESSMGVIRDIVYDCGEFFDCVDQYHRGQDQLKQVWDGLEDFRQNSISQTAANDFESFVKGFERCDEAGAPLTKELPVNGGAEAIEVKLYSDDTVQEYMDNLEECRYILRIIYDLDATTNDIRQTMLNFLSQPLDAYLGDLVLVESAFRTTGGKPRALPSVRLMGEGDSAVYLPTDTAPSRIFNYSMLQRLVDPTISRNDRPVKRTALSSAINVMMFRKQMREEQHQIPMATSLGMGYMLNMHQAWVPDGFALGDLLYSLVLAPGEEQRIIVQERKESYMVDDQASAADTIDDTYRNTQQDNETAAFTQAADRYSAAHSDYSYQSQAKSGGKSKLGFFFGLTASSSASSSNSGSGQSNASQQDSYDEASHAAQNFQTEIKTESARLATAKRASIRIASSSESESVSSKIIANHNHSHVMTVQYWEVTRRYRMETCISGIDLVLFVPLQMIRFLPDPDKRYAAFSGNILSLDSYRNFSCDILNYRYSNILPYADILMDAVPSQHRGGLKLMQKFAALPGWTTATTAGNADEVTVRLTGYFLETDRLSARLRFRDSRMELLGEVEAYEGISVLPSMNTRKDVLYALKRGRLGKVADRSSKRSGVRLVTTRYTEEPLEKVGVTIRFYLPAGVSRNDIVSLVVENDLSDYQIELSQDPEYMTSAEKQAVMNYDHWKYNFSHDNTDNSKDLDRMAHYEQGLPECYLEPIVTLNRSDLMSLGTCNFSVEMDDAPVGTGQLKGSTATIRLENRIPTLGFQEITEMENALHHIANDSIGYSQVVWSSLSDDERIMMLEPYTVEMKFDKILSGENYMSSKPVTVSLLSCVNAKKLLGFYGNCMLLPFSYPRELAEVLGKTAAEVQDELYRFHTTNFRVPTTVISVPTEGMVGEAVLGATNVSEKIDITRFWNWKDSEIDHMSIDQSSFNKHSLLDNAGTMRVDAPTQGVQATGHIDGSGLLAALLQRSQPTFADVLANTDIRDLLKNADNNASSGREQIVKSNSETLKATIEAAAQVATAALGAKAKAPGSSGSGSGSNSGSNSGGTSGNSSDGGSASGSGEGSAGASDSEESNPGSPGSVSTGSNNGGGSDNSGGASPGTPQPKPEGPNPAVPKPAEPGASDDDVPGQSSDPVDPIPGESLTSHNLVDDMMKALNQGMDPVTWLTSEYVPLKGKGISLTEADIERIARITCAENGTTPETLYGAVMEAIACELEGES